MPDLVERVQRVKGVAMARVEIVKDYFDQSARLDPYAESWLKQRGLKVIPLPVRVP